MGPIALYDEEPAPRRSYNPAAKLLLLPSILLVSCYLLSGSLPGTSFRSFTSESQDTVRPQCPAQPAPIVPSLPFDVSSSFRDEAANRLAQAVRIPTVNFDDVGLVTEDPRWKVFYDLHALLDETYKDLYDHPDVNLTLVNHLGRVTTIQGADRGLKPLVLMAHMDVVPVAKETIRRWTYQPFEGAIDADGRYVWGRGSSDCKSLLMAQFEAISFLLKQGWKPKRTVILASGFDEETTGQQGAKKIAEYLENVYGQNSMLMVIDEGNEAERIYGQAFALPATSEKGYLDVQISVGTPGGHSSVPPKHTGIGILAQIVQAIEAGSYKSGFAGLEDPILQFQLCAEKYASAYPREWRKLIKKGDWKGLAKAYAKSGAQREALISTTQAVDVIQAGVKVNALPELSTAIVNHRISFTESVADVQKHVANIVRPLAKAHKLQFDSFTNNTELGSSFVQLSIFGEAIEPAPHSPVSGPIWDLFAGSIRHTLKEAGGRPYIVSPFASSGNTDTQRYWNLTNAIYRYIGAPIEEYESNIHTVDEKMSIDSHVKIVEWLHVIIQNADAFQGNVKNDDTSWLISFKDIHSDKAFHLVIDPWLDGSQVDYFPLFSRQTHAVKPAFSDLRQVEDSLDGSISAILLSHMFTDHTHQATLETAPDKGIPVFGHPQALKRLDNWHIFDATAPFRIYNAQHDVSPLPDSLGELAESAGMPGTQIQQSPHNVSVLYIPTNDWTDPASDKLHGLTLLCFRVTEPEPHTYSILYSPHGLPTSSLTKTIAALTVMPSHTCLALIHNFDFIRLPLLGKVNLGKESGNGIVQALRPKYYIRTHDELKNKSGLVGAVLQRERENLEGMQKYVGDASICKIMESGEFLELLK